MIPLAKKLQGMNCNVIIGSGKEHLSMFRNELPGLTYINFPGFKPAYSHFLPQYISLFLKIPFLLYHIILEHFRLKKIIRNYSVDIVISDNRFGLWNKKVKTVYITHMPLIPFPKSLRFMEPIGVFLHRSVIKKYNHCLIPDLPGEMNVSGRLSHGIILPDNVKYIGILSKFTSSGVLTSDDTYPFKHNTIILSGPEPQRTILKEKLISLLKNQSTPTAVLEGRPDKKIETSRSDNILYYTHLASKEMKKMILGSENIISRSGYSTIMELLSLNCSALLIPTPGQTEQEYLAEYLNEKGWFTVISQRDLHLGISFPLKKAVWPQEIIGQSNILLDKVLREILVEPKKKT
jgi:UDP-N-acetylglucosamine transferase subunit ALG13